MLRDDEVDQLRKDPDYARLTRLGLGQFVADLVQFGLGDLKPDLSFVVKVISILTKARTISAELAYASREVLERLLNRELDWPHGPVSIEQICESRPGALWLRYDLQRAKLLFTRTRMVLTDAGFRTLVKRHSSIRETEMNERLSDLELELKYLEEETLQSIVTQGLFDAWIDARKEQYYTKNADRIRSEFLGAGKGGFLSLPAPRPEDENDLQ